MGLTREGFLEKRSGDRAARQREAAAARDAEEEARRALPSHWDRNRRPDSAGLILLFFIGLPLTLLSGIAVLVVLMLQGLPAWVALVAVPVGFVGGWLLCWGIDEAVCAVLDRLVGRSAWVYRHGEDLYGYTDLTGVVIPPLLTIGVSLVLLWLVG